MDKVMYIQLVCLLDIYKGRKRECGGHDQYIYYSGACDALEELKNKMDRYEAERTK